MFNYNRKNYVIWSITLINGHGYGYYYCIFIYIIIILTPCPPEDLIDAHSHSEVWKTLHYRRGGEFMFLYNYEYRQYSRPEPTVYPVVTV